MDDQIKRAQFRLLLRIVAVAEGAVTAAGTYLLVHLWHPADKFNAILGLMVFVGFSIVRSVEAQISFDREMTVPTKTKEGKRLELDDLA